MFGSGKKLRSFYPVVIVAVLSAAAAVAQSNDNPPAAPQTTSSSALSATPPSRRARRASRVACWKEAGIAADQVNEAWKLQDAGQEKINGACSNSKLTAEERREMIHEINDETDRETARLMSAKQFTVYKTCKVRQAKAKVRGPQEKELGPCGGTVPVSMEQDAGHSQERPMMSHPNN